MSTQKTREAETRSRYHDSRVESISRTLQKDKDRRRGEKKGKERGLSRVEGHMDGEIFQCTKG